MTNLTAPAPQANPASNNGEKPINLFQLGCPSFGGRVRGSLQHGPAAQRQRRCRGVRFRVEGTVAWAASTWEYGC